MAEQTINTLSELCDHFGADHPAGLNRRLYKDTSCGASISLHLSDAKRCSMCERFFASYRCNSPLECDCPRCQGYCACEDGRWLHSGRTGWAHLTDADVDGFTIQTIVEGSDATVDSDLFTFPVLVKVLDAWMESMELEAARLWREANTDEDDPCEFIPTPDADGWICTTHDYTMIQRHEPNRCIVGHEQDERRRS